MALTTRRPLALRRGDTIALVSPSARLEHLFPLRIERAVAYLESQGFVVRVMSQTLPPEARTASSAKPSAHAASVAARAAELHAAFADPAVRAVVCCIGGLSANELLPVLDYDLLRANPKIFVGSSDITLLHHALRAGAGLRTFYGPCAITQLGEFPAPLEFMWTHFLQVLGVDDAGAGSGGGGAASAAAEPAASTSTVSFASATRPAASLVDPIIGWPVPRSPMYTDEFLDWANEPDNLRARQLRPSRGWRWLRTGRAQGRLWGGCLPSVLQPFGTPWAADYAGRILLLELPEGFAPGTPWLLDMARQNLADLRLRGLWDEIVGLVVGRPYMLSDQDVQRWEEMLLNQTEGYKWPILAGVDVGHTDPVLTVPLDAMCCIDSERDEWVFLEASVEAR